MHICFKMSHKPWDNSKNMCFGNGVDEIPAYVFLFPVLNHPATAMLGVFTPAALPIRLHFLAANYSQEWAALGVHSGSSWYTPFFTPEVSVVYSVDSSKWDALPGFVLL